MLERAIDAARVEGGVRERQRRGVALHEFGWQPCRARCAPSGVDHRRAAVDADGASLRGHDARQLDDVIAATAADVQDRSAGSKRQKGKSLPLVVLRPRLRADLPQVLEEEGLILGAVDVGPALRFAAYCTPPLVIGSGSRTFWS